MGATSLRSELRRGKRWDAFLRRSCAAVEFETPYVVSCRVVGSSEKGGLEFFAEFFAGFGDGGLGFFVFGQ